MNNGGALIPVLIRLACIRIGLHLCQHLVRNAPDDIRVRSHDAKRDRPWRIRPEDESDGAYTGFGCQSSGYLLAKPVYEIVSVLCIRRQNDHLGEVWIGQLGIVGEPEA